MAFQGLFVEDFWYLRLGFRASLSVFKHQKHQRLRFTTKYWHVFTCVIGYLSCLCATHADIRPSGLGVPRL